MKNEKPKAELSGALLKIFEHVYVINLESRPDRRKEIAWQLARIGLSFDHPSVTLFPASRPADKGEFPTIGTRGCYESHLGVMRAAQQSGWTSYLVLEDDADLSDDFEDRIVALAASAASTEWDIFYGWTPNTYGKSEKTTSALFVEIPPDEGVRLSHFMGLRTSILADMLPYLEAIYHRPLGDPRGGAMHVDGAISWFRANHPSLRTIAPEAPISVQRPSRSDIHAPKWFDRITFLSPIVTQLRRIKASLR